MARFGVPPKVLSNRAALVQVGHDAALPDLVELDALRLDLLLALWLEERQPQISEHQPRELVDRDLRFVVIDAGLLPRARSLAGPFLSPGLLSYDVANLCATFALPGVLLPA